MLTTNKPGKAATQKINRLLRDPKFEAWADNNGLFQTMDTENEDYWRGIIRQDMENYYRN